jgi:hypothetical protein
MFDLIKSDQASSPTAAGQLVASEDSEPAQYAYRRLASKFITKYGLYRLEREPWGEVCRRIASEMQTK